MRGHAQELARDGVGRGGECLRRGCGCWCRAGEASFGLVDGLG
jgi:hypothetical protein